MCTIPGRPIQTEFQSIDSTHFILTVTQPHNIELFTIALTQPLQSNDIGIGIYLSLTPFNEFTYVGMLNNNQPSTACWNSLRDKLLPTTDSMRIGLCIEPMNNLSTLIPEDVKQSHSIIDDAKMIAYNLIEYIQSYHSDPAFDKAVQKWYDKFIQKHKLNPFFWRKQNT